MKRGWQAATVALLLTFAFFAYESLQLSLRTTPAPPPCPAGVEIRLLTPLRVKSEGRPAGRTALDFGAFFSVLLRRISMLTYFHGEVPLETDFQVAGRGGKIRADGRGVAMARAGALLRAGNSPR